MEHHIAFIQQMVTQGGPLPTEYELFTNWLHEIAAAVEDGNLTKQDIESLRAAFGDALSTKTLQGFGLVKPHGYPGDYEMLDKIYQQSISDNPNLKNWDLYFHVQSAPIAVRNRKEYFKRVLSSIENSNHNEGPIYVLNVASGSARDLFEFLCGCHNGNFAFDCIEWDKDAIAYAKSLCAEFSTCVEFFQGNALKFNTAKRYRLIWSAGLFDYLDDAKFKYLLQRLLAFLDENGEIVVGNFSKNNPTRNYMEIIGEWYLHHRSSEELERLAQECDVSQGDMRVGYEPESVNLFLHIKRGRDFVKI